MTEEGRCTLMHCKSTFTTMSRWAGQNSLEWLPNVAHTVVLLCCFVTISENDNHSLQVIWEYSPQMPLFICCLQAARGDFQKANLRLSEIVLNSYLFAAGLFFAISLLCIGAEINHVTSAPHQYDLRKASQTWETSQQTKEINIYTSKINPTVCLVAQNWD